MCLKEMACLDAEKPHQHGCIRYWKLDSLMHVPSTRPAISCNFVCTHYAGRVLCSSCLGNHEGHGLIQVHKSTLYGKCGLVLIFEREIFVMLALHAVQILSSSSNIVVNVVDELLEKRRVSKISICLAPPSPSIHYPSSRLVPCRFYHST